jgi:hypothetical protein
MNSVFSERGIVPPCRVMHSTYFSNRCLWHVVIRREREGGAFSVCTYCALVGKKFAKNSRNFIVLADKVTFRRHYLDKCHRDSKRINSRNQQVPMKFLAKQKQQMFITFRPVIFRLMNV